MKKCKHINKAYSNESLVLACYPPITISKWICKDCGFQGEDRSQGTFNTEYTDTLQKFSEWGNITKVDCTISK